MLLMPCLGNLQSNLRQVISTYNCLTSCKLSFREQRERRERRELAIQDEPVPSGQAELIATWILSVAHRLALQFGGRFRASDMTADHLASAFDASMLRSDYMSYLVPTVALCVMQRLIL